MSDKRLVNDSELKDVVKAIGDTELLISEITQGFSFAEVGQLVAVAQDLPKVLKDASVLFPEFSALDDDARADLIAFVQVNCKFPSNLTIEAWVQKVLQAAILLSSILPLFK